MPKESDGITFLNYIGTEAKTYTITARLKYGYEWDGNDVTEENKKDDIKFSCKIKKIYTITFDGNGATSGTMNNQQCFEGEVCKLNSNGFSKKGHKFKGWSKNKDNTVKYKDGNRIEIDSDINLYAVWEANSYTITYAANGGTGAPSAQTYTYSDTGSITLSSTKPTRTGYTFSAWTWNNHTYSPGQAWNKNNADNYTLTAAWTINVCTVTYSPNGGTFNNHANSTVQSVNYGGYFGDTENGMRDAKGGYYDAKKNGYYITSSNAWKKGSTTYNEGNRYSAQTICGNLGSGSQSVTLEVNWHKSSSSSTPSTPSAPSCTWTVCKGIVSSGTQCIDGCGGSTNRCFCRYNCCV